MAVKVRPIPISAILGVLWGLLAARSAWADTVRLKGGGFIYDCQVVHEDNTMVSLRTPQGRMGVPRSMVLGISRGRSVFNSYDEQRARVSESDPEALYRLAEWCHKTAGLRSEMVELAEKVIALKEDHSGARRLLGHVRIDGKWRSPPPLLILLRVPTDKVLEEDLRSQLSYMLEPRKDVRLASGARKAVSKGTEGCEIVASALASKRGGVRFFGQELERPKVYSSVTLRAQADWLSGGSQTTVGSSGNLALEPGKNAAFVDALRQNASVIHNFLDGLIMRRVVAIEAASAPKPEPEAPPAAEEKSKDSKKK